MDNNEETSRNLKNKCEISEHFQCFDFSHAKSQTISRGCRCCCNIVRWSLQRFTWFFRMCLSVRWKSTTNFGVSPFFLRRVTTLIGRETNNYSYTIITIQQKSVATWAHICEKHTVSQLHDAKVALAVPYSCPNSLCSQHDELVFVQTKQMAARSRSLSLSPVHNSKKNTDLRKKLRPDQCQQPQVASEGFWGKKPALNKEPTL